MRRLQHRGKAYWKMIVGEGAAGAEGSLPADETILRIAQKEKLLGNNGIGYLSKRPPPFPSMNSIWVVFDGFFVDTEKLHLHPYIGSARDSDYQGGRQNLRLPRQDWIQATCKCNQPRQDPKYHSV